MWIEPGTKFGQLEVIEEVSPYYYACGCQRCRFDGALATADALLTGRVTMCFDCAELAKMTPHQRVVLAFFRKLDLSTEQEALDNVPSIHGVPRLTTAGALSEAA